MSVYIHIWQYRDVTNRQLFTRGYYVTSFMKECCQSADEQVGELLSDFYFYLSVGNLNYSLEYHDLDGIPRHHMISKEIT